MVKNYSSDACERVDASLRSGTTRCDWSGMKGKNGWFRGCEKSTESVTKI